MKCPTCGTEMHRDAKKWLAAVIGLDERLYALYYCPNEACTEHRRLICRNKETDTPFNGPWTPEYADHIETTYA
jgi:hypothetical protein